MVRLNTLCQLHPVLASSTFQVVFCAFAAVNNEKKKKKRTSQPLSKTRFEHQDLYMSRYLIRLPKSSVVTERLQRAVQEHRDDMQTINLFRLWRRNCLTCPEFLSLSFRRLFRGRKHAADKLLQLIVKKDTAKLIAFWELSGLPDSVLRGIVGKFTPRDR